MLAVISPAKSLDFETPARARKHTQPDFLGDSAELADTLRGYSPARLKKLMRISDKLAGENAQRWQDFEPPFTPDNAKVAIEAFTGDVYLGLDASTLSARDFTWIQKHLRILSGLYGLLRPLDLIQPYRLEMGTSIKTPRGKDLYRFWGDKLTAAVNDTLAEQRSKVLVNLASNEYFSALQPEEIDGRVITPVFKDKGKDGRYRVMSFYAKRARGAMVRYLVDQRATSPSKLQAFDSLGYRFSPEDSDADRWVYLRDTPPAPAS